MPHPWEQPFFMPWTRHHYLGTPRPVHPAHLTTQEYPGIFNEWRQFDLWNPWVTGGRKTRRPDVWVRVPDWAWTIRRELGKLQHSQNPNPPVPPPPVPHPQFPVVPSKTKGHNGLYFYNYEHADIDQMIWYAQRYKLWVALLVHELNRAPIPTYDTQAQLHKLKSAGITVVASGWVDADFDLDSQVEAAVQYSAGFDEYMLNAEYSWAWKGSVDPGFLAMGPFAKKLRQRFGPYMPFSLSCMWGQVTWFRPLLEAGLSTVRPQCYLNQYSHMNPAGAIVRGAYAQADLPGGIPAHMIEATYGKYGGFMNPLSDWTAEDAAAEGLGMKARSVWAAEFCTPGDLDWLVTR